MRSVGELMIRGFTTAQWAKGRVVVLLWLFALPRSAPNQRLATSHGLEPRDKRERRSEGEGERPGIACRPSCPHVIAPLRNHKPCSIPSALHWLTGCDSRGRGSSPGLLQGWSSTAGIGRMLDRRERQRRRHPILVARGSDLPVPVRQHAGGWGRGTGGLGRGGGGEGDLEGGYRKVVRLLPAALESFGGDELSRICL